MDIRLWLRLNFSHLPYVMNDTYVTCVSRPKFMRGKPLGVWQTFTARFFFFRISGGRSDAQLSAAEKLRSLSIGLHGNHTSYFRLCRDSWPRVHPWTLHKRITHTRGFLWKMALENSRRKMWYVFARGSTLMCQKLGVPLTSAVASVFVTSKITDKQL